MKHLADLTSNRGFKTRICSDDEYNFRTNAETGDVDAFILPTDDGFSPLGIGRDFFADDLGIPVVQIQRLADWNRYDNERVTLVALKSRKEEGWLRGIILAPYCGSRCFNDFRDSARDFDYYVTYATIAYASNVWKAHRLGISHLPQCEAFVDGDIVALTRFCNRTVYKAALDSFSIIGWHVDRISLNRFFPLDPQRNCVRSHRLTFEREVRDGAVLIHL